MGVTDLGSPAASQKKGDGSVRNVEYRQKEVGYSHETMACRRNAIFLIYLLKNDNEKFFREHSLVKVDLSYSTLLLRASRICAYIYIEREIVG